MARTWRVPAGAAALVLLVAMLYSGTLDNGFHYDDTHSILDNVHLRHLGNLPRFFLDPGTFSREPGMAMYRPLVVTTFALNYAVDGDAPRGYHLANVAAHAAAAVVVFAVLRGLGAAGAAWLGAALFALHPVQSQALNYISSRSEILAGLGVLAAYYLSARPARRGVAVACYAGALLCKETAVVLPLLLLLRQAGGPRPARWWRPHAPFWGVTAAYLGLITANHFLTHSLAQEVRPYGQHLLTQAKALPYYGYLTAMPVHLSIEHPLALATGPGSAPVLAGLALGASVCVLAWRASGALRLGVAWVGAAMALTSLVPLNVLVNEHRLYLPLAGLAVLLTAAHGQRRAGVALRAAALGVLALLAVLTWQRSRVWHDDLSLWGDAVTRAPDSFRAQSNWGLALFEAGRLDAARQALERSLALQPEQAKAWNTLGLVHEAAGDRQAAQAALARALELRPDLAGARANLARLVWVEGRTDEARQQLQRALDDDPLCTAARVALGLLLQQQGALAEAMTQYEAALRVEPGCLEARTDLALALEQAGQGERALAELRQVAAQDPGYAEGRINLALLEGKRDGRTARQVYEELSRQLPERFEVWVGLAAACAAEGRLTQAAAACARAAALRPGDARLQANCLRLHQAAAGEPHSGAPPSPP